MQLVLFCKILACMFLCHHATAIDILKPNFVPYCTTRDKCKAACSCEVAPNCTILEMDETLRKSILFYHNQIRDIQSAGEPIPGGMTMLQYDDNLEEISKCWAARCENEYSECFTTSRFNETSQSVVQVTIESEQTPKMSLWMQMMNFWLGQAKSISAETLSDLPAGEEGENIHNFAQLLSDRVLFVGCAWSTVNSTITFVCTYGPRGPLQGESIYKIGQQCSLCPKSYACDFAKPFSRLCKELEPPATAPTPPSPPPVAPTPVISIPVTAQFRVQSTTEETIQEKCPEGENSSDLLGTPASMQIGVQYERPEPRSRLEFSPSHPMMPHEQYQPNPRTSNIQQSQHFMMQERLNTPRTPSLMGQSPQIMSRPEALWQTQLQPTYNKQDTRTQELSQLPEGAGQMQYSMMNRMGNMGPPAPRQPDSSNFPPPPPPLPRGEHGQQEQEEPTYSYPEPPPSLPQNPQDSANGQSYAQRYPPPARMSQVFQQYQRIRQD